METFVELKERGELENAEHMGPRAKHRRIRLKTGPVLEDSMADTSKNNDIELNFSSRYFLSNDVSQSMIGSELNQTVNNLFSDQVLMNAANYPDNGTYLKSDHSSPEKGYTPDLDINGITGGVSQALRINLGKEEDDGERPTVKVSK